MNKTLWAVLAVVVVVGGAWFYHSRSSASSVSASPNDMIQANSDQSAGDAAGDLVPTADTSTVQTPSTDTGTTSTAVKEFTVTGQNFSFAPNTLTVKKGDQVKITFKNADGFHDFRIDEFNVASKRIRGGDSDTVEFTADKVGSFEYYCSVGSHRAMGMKGTLTVTE